MTKQQKMVQTARKMYMGHMYGKVYLSDEGLEKVVNILLGNGISEEEVVNDAIKGQIA